MVPRSLYIGGPGMIVKSLFLLHFRSIPVGGASGFPRVPPRGVCACLSIYLGLSDFYGKTKQASPTACSQAGCGLVSATKIKEFRMASYQCPYCDHHQVMTDPNTYFNIDHFYVQNNAEGLFGAWFSVLSCANKACKQSTVHLIVGELDYDAKGRLKLKADGKTFFNRRILPDGAARVFPDYIPAALLEDYREACIIKGASPKAAATLVRRCLQGMIRDFCGIRENTLFQEISELTKRLDEEAAPKGVSIETVEAIDHVRSIGNIGAHMENDINLIVPVEPEEADLLIGLVEMLFEEWYVARHRRQERLEKIRGAADSKREIKALAKAALPTEPPEG